MSVLPENKHCTEEGHMYLQFEFTAAAGYIQINPAPFTALLDRSQPTLNAGGFGTSVTDGGGSRGGGSERSPRGRSAAAGMGGVANEHDSCAEDVATVNTTATSAAASGAAATATVTAAAGENDCTSDISVELEGPHGVVKKITKGDIVELRWGPKDLWYRCAVSMLNSGGIGEEGGVMELEFITAMTKNTNSDRGKVFTHQYKVVELLADGDLAVPGTHMVWD